MVRCLIMHNTNNRIKMRVICRSWSHLSLRTLEKTLISAFSTHRLMQKNSIVITITVHKKARIAHRLIRIIHTDSFFLPPQDCNVCSIAKYLRNNRPTILSILRDSQHRDFE
jgi:hypothetical protein